MRRLIAGAMIAWLASGCTPGPQPAASPGVSAVNTVTNRTVKVPVPDSYEAPFLEFASATHGYALFVSSRQPTATAKLFRTIDGGQNWTELTHPQPEASNHQLYVAGPDTVVLLTEPRNWQISRDGGTTWVQKPYTSSGPVPDEYPDYTGRHLLQGRTALPGFEDAAVVRDGQERLWQASIKDGQPVTAMSAANARTFSGVPVKPQPSRPLMRAWIAVSPDGTDVWLIAEQEPQSIAGRRSVRMKAAGLPLLWRLENGAWEPHLYTGIKEDPRYSYSVTPVGERTLLLSTPEGSGYLSDRFVLVPGTPRLSWVGALRDGTVMGSGEQAGVLFLSEGGGSQRDWIRVQLSR